MIDSAVMRRKSKSIDSTCINYEYHSIDKDIETQLITNWDLRGKYTGNIHVGIALEVSTKREFHSEGNNSGEEIWLDEEGSHGVDVDQKTWLEMVPRALWSWPNNRLVDSYKACCDDNGNGDVDTSGHREEDEYTAIQGCYQIVVVVEIIDIPQCPIVGVLHWGVFV